MSLITSTKPKLLSTLLKTLKLLLPAIIPSWNFFDFIAPSPRIQYTLLNKENQPQTEWQEFRPRPDYVSLGQMLKRMLWNPWWNECLFLMSCAERILANPTKHSEDEILKRIQNDLAKEDKARGATHLQFRLVLVERQGETLVEEIVFHSRLESFAAGDMA